MVFDPTTFPLLSQLDVRRRRGEYLVTTGDGNHYLIEPDKHIRGAVHVSGGSSELPRQLAIIGGHDSGVEPIIAPGELLVLGLDSGNHQDSAVWRIRQIEDLLTTEIAALREQDRRDSGLRIEWLTNL